MRESAEDYLETIYLLLKRKPDLHAVDVASELGFSKPSVTRALKLLRGKGYIVVDELNHISLTAKGLKQAQDIFWRHQTISKFLQLLGVDEEIAAKDACRMEHDVSAQTLAAFEDFIKKQEQD